jgi:hypothetical protein
MSGLRRLVACVATSVALAATVTGARQKDDKPADKNAKEQDPRPKVSLRAQPVIAMSPARVVLTAELTGGANDFQDFYCPAIEWDWGDDTRSEKSDDCAPYEEGKSEIKRRFTVEHTYRRAGNYRISFRMKRHEKIVGAATTNVQIRPGLRDIGQ